MSKPITRKYIERVSKANNRKNVRQSSGGGGGGGGASQFWVEENYISKLFFNRLFTVLDEDGNAIEPNDTETTIESIQSMFGFWSELYISALGQGSGGSAAITLGMLEDVQLTSPQNGQVLKFNGTKWVNGDGGGGGTDMQTVWENLAASGNQQINASHLTNALNGYATQAWVGQQGYLTASAISDMATKTWVNSQISDMATKTWVNYQISDMATKTWVSNNYLGLHATADAATKLATARTLWGQSFDGTANVSGNMSDVGDIALGNGKRIYNAAQGSGGSLYIGRSDDGGWVYISDMCSRQGSTYWNVTSAGNATFANVLSNGYVTALSDIRKKNVTGEVKLDVNAIALARLIRFTWKDRKFDKNEHVGGIAQEWQKILPEAVHESADGTLSMDYGAIGVISAVTIARKVVEQERRLEELEARIKRLENIL